ncbi:tetratricopeptide repeat protein [Methanobrevibacter sp.]|uniref:tetratricopeptide repeat protein n=1 Tax=Methanobrevibacter sp. TaxID=66852 RepID=UPI0026DEB066|nr:tetratricopeptide repeat protein [Methanobrevibacter sp.]MDO5859645.1 tetratricopeptide repeat protein [Methanobrevibacter sp.]
MGIFNKKDKKDNREVGSNFSKDEADEIFDVLDKIDSKESKKLSKNMENQINQSKEISEIINQAKKATGSEAIELYKKVLVIMPENGEAYLGLAEIYHSQNDTENEIKVLKEAIQKIDANNKIKGDLIKRLKDIN